MSTDPTRPSLPLPAPPPLLAPESFIANLESLGISLSPEQMTRLGDYLARLLAMNEQMNLTAITAPQEAWTRHILDSLTLLPFLMDLQPKAKLLDVGSGGGVPGIPLAIARPDLAITLLEATQKKAAFLAAVSSILGCTHVEIAAGRAEQLLQSPLRASFDVVTARAVARLNTLLPWVVPFTKNGGRILLIKGERASEELAEARSTMANLGCEHEETQQTPTGRIMVLRKRSLKPSPRSKQRKNR